MLSLGIMYEIPPKSSLHSALAHVATFWMVYSRDDADDAIGDIAIQCVFGRLCSYGWAIRLDWYDILSPLSSMITH